MRILNKITAGFIIITLTNTLAQAETEVYSWRAENGNVVFSETKPSEDIDYKIINVGQPTVVDTKSPEDSKGDEVVKIEQNDIQKLNNSQLAEENKQVLKENQNDLDIQVTSPADEANIFTKETYIPIKTNPALTANDKPTFIVNGNSVSASFENGYWQIARPTPGKNEIIISGQTADGRNINQVTDSVFYIKNGWLQQSKNTGN
ncbi:DUF4124 domain-containing protein [Allofrancisella guangzhouensis]|uniref:DUF4124 domain-containing protein n=1 Tax=Allofrancisella guangzhouensis TaxID=594679 RepID=A0A0A8E647_9GAMM|nr:DUF4124 domain-containing protein [Allofrancisella guangzhouensis]AJC49444.1 hypothetical protein SD28_07350 [Allofrancisella guangzhouensis]MBK2026738.1 DUF4124 domain-containing protein [Allofrancisella guangzhouensis]MBK2043663.1 DUF4124 domain-containing protein [Allofrancisella guangzhouensis]MBK2046182.1 DUF4124 domain-containing protein [Allofrancisella guangzhouensis]